MSPRYFGGKYRSRLQPRSRKCACRFLRETERVKSNCARPASAASHGDNEVDHLVCLKAEFHMHAVLSNENGKFYTTMIYPCFSRSVCFSMGSLAWWRLGLCSSGSSLVSRWRDAPLVREFQMWRRRCKQRDPHWFQGRQMRFWWMWSTISWKYFLIYQARLFSTVNIQPEPSCILFSTVHWLLLQPVNHRQQPVTSRLPWTCCGLVSTAFSRKIYFLCIDQYLF